MSDLTAETTQEVVNTHCDGEQWLTNNNLGRGGEGSQTDRQLTSVVVGGGHQGSACWNGCHPAAGQTGTLLDVNLQDGSTHQPTHINIVIVV